MFLELHILQNFSPSNLNRDDTGSPKDCEFGGYRRARVSSQSWKRAMREDFRTRLKPEQRGVRTKRIVDECARQFAEAHGGGEAERSRGAQIATVALKACELAVDQEAQTQYLLFVGAKEIAELARLCDKHEDALLKAAEAGSKKKAAKGASGGESGSSDDEGAKSKKNPPKLDKEVLRELNAWLGKGKGAIDVALFGRMLADLPEHNVDAASQVAHAISTNKLTAAFDYFTAVDDLKPEDTEGAGMIGTVGFNSSCFYRYLNLDLNQLDNNLGGGYETAIEAAKAWMLAAIHSIPSGKQNSMAAQNLPFFVMAVVRDSGLRSLSHAFIDPVRPMADADLAAGSVKKLLDHWKGLSTMYGETGVAYAACLSPVDEGAGLSRLGSVEEVVENAAAALTSK